MSDQFSTHPSSEFFRGSPIRSATNADQDFSLKFHVPGHRLAAFENDRSYSDILNGFSGHRQSSQENCNSQNARAIVNQLSLDINVTDRPSQIPRFNIWHALRHLSTLPGYLHRRVQQALLDREIRKIKRAFGVTAETERYEL